MKALVPVKRVVDYNVKIRVKPDKSGVELDNIKMSMNPFDEVSVEEALKLKEAGKVEEVIVVSIGVEKCKDTLLAGLAMGADRGILVQSEGRIEPLAVAKVLTEIAKREDAGIIIVGKQAIDDDCNQTGQMLAALLGWGQATFVSSLSIEGEKLTAVREVDGGLAKVSMKLPAVITTDLRLNEPRYASLPNIMKAKKKPLDHLSAEDLGIDMMPRHQVIEVREPPERPEGVRVASVDELVEKLKTEAGVL